MVFLFQLSPKAGKNPLIVTINKAVVNVEDFYAATSQKAHMILRDVLGQYTFDALSTQLDTVTHQIQMVLESEIAQWGLTADRKN